MALVSPKMVGGGSFVTPFEWNGDSVVIIKYKHGGGHIRAHPHNHELCDHKGGQTEWAKWKVHLSENNTIAQLEHVKTGKYLEMDKFVTSINVSSEGGSTSRWIVHQVDSNCVRLESVRNKGFFLGVKPHDGVTVVNGDNLDSKSYQYQFTFLYFFIEGQKDEGYFEKPYLMKSDDIVIVKHPQNASLRTNPNDERELDMFGQKEMNARWEVNIINSNNSDNSNSSNNTNNSNNSNNNNNSNESESNNNSNNNTNDNNSNNSNANESNSKNSNESNSSENEKKSSLEKPDVENNETNGTETTNNNNNNNTSSDSVENSNNNNINNSNDGKDGKESKDDDSDIYDDSHEKTNITLQFCSVKSGGYIKLNDNKISMSRKGDDFTKFRVYIVEQPNIVKLESIQHPGCYIRITEKKGIHVGKGGAHCQMTLLRME